MARVAIGIGDSGDVEYMQVRQQDTGGPCGWLDRGKREIVIRPDQPEVAKHLVLLHEMCHAAAEDLKAAGIIKRQPSEEFISCFAARLFGMLTFSELWRGVTPDQSREFFTEQHGAPARRAGTRSRDDERKRRCPADLGRIDETQHG